MSDLSERLARLEASHRQALLWFWERRGTTVPWPGQVNGLFLVNKAKGIHKPAGWEHALSVRQVLNGPYADRDLVVEPDGSWTYDYFQEGSDPAKRDREATNRGLMACQRDGVPVAVLHQTRPKPGVQYRVLGLASVDGWSNGYFHLRGFNDIGELGAVGLAPIHLGSSATASSAPLSLEDARKRIETSIVARQGSGTFRELVLKGYGRRCAISTCDVPEALEAAHIVPYLGAHTDRLENALLLRGDLHTLFDRQLLSVDVTTLRVTLAPALMASAYADLHLREVRLPAGVTVESMRASLVKRLEALAPKATKVA